MNPDVNQIGRSGQRGDALVEFAFIILVMCLLAVGTVNFGFAIQRSLLLVEAAQEGALCGSFDSYNSSQTASSQSAALLAGVGATGLTASGSTFCTCTPGGASVACSSSCSGDQPMMYVQVTTTLNVSSIIPFPSLPASWSLQSTAVMPVD